MNQKQGFKTKRIIVNSGHRISLQCHSKRSEHWIITKGEAYITINESGSMIYQGDIAFIDKNDIHRIENIGLDKLVFIEIQIGDELEEDDILRLEDDYGR